MIQVDNEKEPAKVISFINLKGGVGKTSAAINIADELSKEGNLVLVVDMDPQFNATQALLDHQFSHHKYFIDNTLLEEVTAQFEKEFKESLENESLEKFEEKKLFQSQLNSQLIYSHLKSKNLTVNTLFQSNTFVSETETSDLIYRIKSKLHLMPGDLDLFQTLPGDTSGKHNILEDHFSEHSLRDKYNYIIIDCPPNWTILTQASLFASDYYIIPSKIDLFSSIGIGLLDKLITSTFYKKSDIHILYKMYREKLKKQKIQSLGVLFTLTHDMTISWKLKDKLVKEISQEFFVTEIPYQASVPLKFSLYDEGGTKHDALKYALSKIKSEIEGKIEDKMRYNYEKITE
ncbi:MULTISPECIES: ParA family protein [Lysinibacillus]|uniref:ParA family protein n=1 Tax=Lysinibacillus TaxID=400634 RepID=UPI0021A292EE|nr:AAA family ATPase [Lysinibacillus capsici]MCT1538336.1 AAA family ATPase [Lysinibacillus capsici]MCT1569044.1 AAA family ATPase [Lysinibacillus capsici]MCT1646059.1 AAA family ATPase [Lysinibacillus capsici]MCT1725435.1 AAA family ATPase [Lysinibacillus capsici]MCT1784215.1 AAA family ATPase [Lysinibacillus capsici]